MNDKTCRRCQAVKPTSDFTRKASSVDGLSPYCRSCQQERRVHRKFNRPASRSGAVLLNPVAEALPTVDPRDDFVIMPEVRATFAAAARRVQRGRPAPTFFFAGPSGSGKTETARQLAHLAGLDCTVIDAPSMTDPEAWFGTREVVVEDGAPKTVVVDSAFVSAIGRPGVVVIDEANRVNDFIRGVILALTDERRAVTNPLTGQPLVRHPECYLMMTANVGLSFTGTFAVDPAFMTRALTTNFEYLKADDEERIARGRTGAPEDDVALIVRLATDSRAAALADEDFPPVSTREVLEACELVADGLDVNTAVHQAIINRASNEGGAQSVRARYEMFWTGIRPKA